MKNSTDLYSLSQCVYCNLKGFFCYIGNNYTTQCPSCKSHDYVHSIENENTLYLREIENDSSKKTTKDTDMRVKYSYCKSCKIMFDIGCIHYKHVKTPTIDTNYNVYNGHFIKKWIDKVTNEPYEGMPLFEDEQDWFENANNVEVIEMYCPHKGSLCGGKNNKAK